HVGGEGRAFLRLAFRIIIKKGDQRAIAIAGIAAHEFSHSVAFAFLASSRRRTVNPWYNRVFTVLSGQPTSSAISWNVSPWYSFSTIAVRCSSGRRAIAFSTRRVKSFRAT